jgi:uracil-DNA glycosylase
MTFENPTYSTKRLIDYLDDYGFPSGWEDFFESQRNELVTISDTLFEIANRGIRIFPPLEMVFRIFYAIKPENAKVLMLGQDPYVNGSAVGFAFSVKSGNKLNRSLVNMKTELKNEGFTVSKDSGDLSNWVAQGVFLLNTALTVEKDKSMSHYDLWTKFSTAVIKQVTKRKNMAILLMGSKAKEFKGCVSQFRTHRIIETSHPVVPRSGSTGFYDSNCFLRINEFLDMVGEEKIDFSV